MLTSLDDDPKFQLTTMAAKCFIVGIASPVAANTFVEKVNQLSSAMHRLSRLASVGLLTGLQSVHKQIMRR